MSLSQLLNINCTILRRSLPDEATLVDAENFDRYGNPRPIDPDASDSDYAYEFDTVCWVQQERRTEPGEAGEMSDSFWTVFLPSGTALDTSDAIDIDGYGQFELVGDPWDAVQGSTRIHHIEATVRRTGEGVLAS